MGAGIGASRDGVPGALPAPGARPGMPGTAPRRCSRHARYFRAWL